MRGSVGSLLIICLTLSFFFQRFKVGTFPLLLSLFFPLGLFSFFSVLRLKDHSCLPFVVFTQRVFSSGSLPHAASLTAWVKRTDLPCIANVLRGNRLNYAHCGGEDIHNSAIKLLKVRLYLALQLPAVYRRWGMFCTADMHMSYACVGPDTNWGQTSLLLAYITLQERYKTMVWWQQINYTATDF